MLGKVKNNHLAKHSAAIHISNDITGAERKVYNLLLKNASQSMRSKGIYEINIKDIAKDLGYLQSKNYLFIEEIVKKLVEKSITFNLLKKDNKKKWGGSCSLLAEAIPSCGVIRYSFPPTLEASFANPNIYANLNLDYQRFLNSKHSLALWEFCTEQLDRNKKQIVQTEHIPLEILKTLLGAEENCYNQFKYFNQRVLKKAVTEINGSTDINLEVNFHKDNGKSVSKISFNISRKKQFSKLPRQNEIFENEPNIIQFIHNVIDRQNIDFIANELHLPMEFIDALVKENEVEKVEKALKIIEDKLSQGEKINNIQGYIWTLLDRGIHNNISSKEWKDENLNQIILQNEKAVIGSNPKLESFFSKLKILYNICDYQNWLLKLNFFEEDDNTVKFEVGTNFIKGWLNDKFKDRLLLCWQEINPQIQEFEISVNEKYKDHS